MRVLVIAPRPSGSGSHYPPLDALVAAGHDGIWVGLEDLAVSADPELTLCTNGTPLVADAAFVRTGDEGLAAAIEARGIPVVNRPRSMATSSDKWLTHLALDQAGLAQLPTHLLSAGMGTTHLPYPVVVKGRWGAKGADVTRHDTLEPIWAGLPSVAQPLIDATTDWRVAVANGAVIAWERRTAAPGEWRANVELGATVDVPELPPGAGQLAIDALAALELDYAGVDIVVTEAGPTVIEVNAALGWVGLWSLWGTKLYPLYTEALASRLARE